MAENNPWAYFGNTEDWLKQIGLPTEEAGDIEPPPFPYQVYEDAETTAGPDNAPRALVYHDITVEQYQETKDRTHIGKMEDLLANNELDYTHDRVWLTSEKMYMDTFNFRIIEKHST